MNNRFIIEFKYIRILYIVLAMAVSGVIGIFNYFNDMKNLDTTAKETLIEILNDYLAIRSPNEHIISKGGANPTLPRDSFPREISFISSTGIKNYTVTYEQEVHNITKHRETRFAHSVALFDGNISEDTLNVKWQNLMNGKREFVKTTLHITYLNDTISASTNNEDMNHWFKSLLVHILPPIYIGIASEYKIAGTFSCSMIYIWYNLFIFAGYTLFFLFVGYTVQKRLFKRPFGSSFGKFVELSSMVSDMETGDSRIKPQSYAQPVQKISKSEDKIYLLDEDLYYNASQSLLFLKKDDKVIEELVIKGNQANILLEEFLNVSDHLLSDEQIMQSLWNKDCIDARRIPTAINRLRNYLKEIGSDIKIVRVANSYQLKL